MKVEVYKDDSRKRPVNVVLLDRLAESASYDIQQKINEIKSRKELTFAAIYELIRILLEGTEPQK